MSFVHLRVHSDYSLSDGLCRVKKLPGQIKDRGMPAVALTDNANLFAMVKFYNGCVGAGIQPIMGADVLWGDSHETASALTLLVQSQAGYLRLSEWLTAGFLQHQKNGKVLLPTDLLAAGTDGLIALSGGIKGSVGMALMKGDADEAAGAASQLTALFPNRFYLEISRCGRSHEETVLHQTVALADQLGLPLVATNDVRFFNQGDFEAHETRVCIASSFTLDDPRRERQFTDQQYLKSADEMCALFADVPDAIENTLAIAKRCGFQPKLGTYFLPDYPVPDGKTIDQYFRELSHDGLGDRLAKILPADPTESAALEKTYRDRLDFEVDVILQMGFPGYFLIVMDFINWAKSNGVPVGPGRGSGAGSAVAWALRITDLDPIEYDLLFERFLNPERVSMPDFDVDFCMVGRDRVIDYVAQRYGRNAVSQIITYGSMAAKAVVRDVARAQGKAYAVGDKLSKLIPFEVGMTLEKALEQEPGLNELMSMDEDAAEVMAMSRQLEGTIRGVGKHAGGVVIAPSKLTDFVPVYQPEGEDSPVTQFDKDDVESAGLVKFDFLGLRTLTIIDWALDLIRDSGADVPDIESIPLDDRRTFKLLQGAETTAVFQLESRGMKDLIRRLQPSTFADIIALVALYRPGPLESGMVDDYINRKHGREPVVFPHPDLEPILKDTNGVILYQEQVMQIAQVLAQYSLGSADLLRRAMGKKKPEEMQKQRVMFMQGSGERDVDPQLAGSIFDLMEKFAGYGFNKSHSAAYALVSYQTAWLKTHYPAAFMAAVMSADMGDVDKVVPLIEEARRMGLAVNPPDVNQGALKFTVNDDGAVVYGLGALRGLGEGPISALLDARADGPFSDLFDFCRRVDGTRINKRAIESLIKAGAFDGLNEPRHLLMGALESAMGAANQARKSEAAGMQDLFGLGIDSAPDPSTGGDAYVDVRKARVWNERERLAAEKHTLGLYLTGHPIEAHRGEIREFSITEIGRLRPSREGRPRTAGLIIAIRTLRDRSNRPLAIVTLDDRSARFELVLAGDTFEQYKDALVTDQIVVVEGKVSLDERNQTNKMQVDRLWTLTQARMAFADALEIRFAVDQVPATMKKRLHDILAPQRGGGCPVQFRISGREADGVVKLGHGWDVHPTDELMLQLTEVFGDTAVRLRKEERYA
ncbi:DNA polymerase III subunit alpha [Litorivicinus lipolyticus]|uniref:DNA polymerase III subunit alpha n=1 Tax=Litorivicinus lipolyticus TaxID=418701 RepID=UPI003B5BCAC9